MSMIAAELIAADFTTARAGVEESMQVKGSKTVPGHSDVSAVSFGYDIGAGGFGAGTIKAGELNGTAINGVAVKTRNFIAPDGYTFGTDLPIVPNGDMGCRVLALSVIISYDAAGSIADAGKVLAAQFLYRHIGTSIQAYNQEVRATLISGQLDVILTLNVNDFGFLPNTCALGAYIRKLDGTNWPANTTLSARVLGYFRKPGAQIPR